MMVTSVREQFPANQEELKEGPHKLGNPEAVVYVGEQGSVTAPTGKERRVGECCNKGEYDPQQFFLSLSSPFQLQWLTAASQGSHFLAASWSKILLDDITHLTHSL